VGEVCIGVYVFVCLSVCFPRDISKIDAARITKLDVENVPLRVLETHLRFGSQAQRSRSQGTEKQPDASDGASVSAGFFYFNTVLIRRM